MKSKAVILDLLSASDPTPLPTSSFLGAARRFGVKENTMRVTLQRLVRAGQVDVIGSGIERTHLLSSQSRVLNQHIIAAQTARPRRWNGQWITVLAWAPGQSRQDREHLRRALRILKLGNLQPGVWVRPDNLDLSLETVLAEFGLERDVVWTRGKLNCGGEERALADELFDIAGIEKRIDRACRDLAASLDRLPGLAGDRALKETFTVGGRAIKVLFEDPLLPKEMLPTAWRGEALRRAFARYDRTGRRIWRQVTGNALSDRAAPPIGARNLDALPVLAVAGRN